MKKATVFIPLVLLLLLFTTPAYAVPALPHAFKGSVTVNGALAPDGTQVSATVSGGTVITNEQNPVTTVGGSYGINSPYLLVQGDITNGATITFNVTNANGTATGGTATFEAGGGPTVKNLSVSIAVPPSGGGGGGGGADTTPPTTSDTLSSNITKTSADIGWRTNEPSTSQVEYWSSPSKFSPLDTAMVTNHLVRLTDLTPGTTYHYKTMSKDAAGNLAVSDAYTFTTLGKAATFTTSSLSISPTEVDTGKTVTISATVANSGDVSGTYKATLKINDAVVETKEITVASGASQTVTFTTSKGAAGTYSVAVDGLSGTFIVKAPPAPAPAPAPAPTPAPPAPTPPAPTNWPLLGVIIGGVIVLGLVIVFTARRKAY